MKNKSILSVLFVLTICAISLASSDSMAAKAKKEAASKSVGAPQIEIQRADKDIVEIAAGSPNFKTLVAAVQATELVETLKGAGPYTVFAPTDSAFAKLPKGTVETLLKTENLPKLKSILEHHTAAPRYEPKVLMGLTELDMVDGPKLKIENKGGKIYIEGLELKNAIIATNGIIYVVDTVLLAK